jgi:hypothetical protein
VAPHVGQYRASAISCVPQDVQNTPITIRPMVRVRSPAI